MLKISNLNAYYEEVHVLKDISLRVKKGEITAIIGANAAGKTTLLSCISGLHENFSGTILLEGEDIAKAAPTDIVDMGVVQCPEGRLLFPQLTVRENLELGAFSKRCRGHRKEQLDFVYEALPILKDREKQRAGSLSGGEAQMCAIGRSLMGQPKLLILDEPSLGLAPIMVKQIMNIIENIKNKGITVLLVEQNVRQSLRLATDVFIMENGKILFSGIGKELLADERIKKAYMGI